MKIDKTHRRKTARDDEYIEAYLKYHSQLKAAEECGVGRTTISRALYRAGIEMTGQHKSGNYGGGTPQKITDEQLIEDAKTLNGLEIAQKYNMSAERVYRRAKRLGIKISSIGCGGHYNERAKRYGVSEVDENVTLKRIRARDKDICWICGGKVDDSDIENGHIKRLYPTIDHVMPLSKGGSHTMDNCRLAHMACNAGKCDRLYG